MICKRPAVLTIAWVLSAGLLGSWNNAVAEESPAARRVVASPTTSPTIDVQRDIVYGTAGSEELRLDLARPADLEAKLPCIIIIHGGGWAQGDKSAHREAIRLVAARGYVAATINYRLLPKHLFPAQVQDAKCAVRFLRAHAAQYGIDRERIGAVGDSAGGHLALMLAVTRPHDQLEGDGDWPDTSSAVGAVVSWYGPTDLGAGDLSAIGRGIVNAFLGTSAPNADAPDAAAPNADRVRKASPITYVHSGQPPILLLQGTNDALIPNTQLFSMVNRMTQARAPGRAEFFVGARHGFSGADMSHAVEATFAFFDEHLKGENGSN